MPFKSERQRRFLYAKHPDIAKKFASKEHQNRSRKSPPDITPPPSTPVSSNKGRRVGRNPTPGVPRKVGPESVQEKADRKSMTRAAFNPRRMALMRRLAENRKKS